MKKYVNEIKNKKEAGITLIALTITIIVLIILAGVTIAALSGDSGILTRAQKAKEETEQAQRYEQNILNSYEDKINEYSEDTSGASHPELKDGMQAIIFTEDGMAQTVTDNTKRNWYSYEETTDSDMSDGGTTNGGNSRWANATLNGNYYVWIPRYAYKIDTSITYTSSGGGISHKIDVKFIDININNDNVEKEIGEGYVVHPAFTFGTKELRGFWVGKYETSGNMTSPSILPNVTSLRNINIYDISNTAKSLSTTNYDAHAMKNIEWGAVAYLAQSQYGRNGTEISINQCNDFYTGTGAGIGDNTIYNSSYTWQSITDNQKYNGVIGQLASTTGNIYGVYDMSGGANEYVMGFYKDGYSDQLNKLNILLDNLENKYYDIYDSSEVDDTNIGDALYETKGWNNDYAAFVKYEAPVLLRGGLNRTTSGGIFYYNYSAGTGVDDNGFRVCLSENF